MGNPLITLYSVTVSPGAARSVFLALWCAHLLGDFVFQSDDMVARKRRWGVMALHGLIHAALAAVLLENSRAWPIVAAAVVLHLAIDVIKVRLPGWLPGSRLFWYDQAAHILGLVVLAWWAGRHGLSCGWVADLGRSASAVMMLIIGLVTAVRVAAIAIGFWVQPYLGQIAPSRQGSVAGVAERGLASGGRIIGQWERALIFLFVFLATPGGVGFLIAAKSIFRFGELSDRQNRMEAEYITIGTLISFTTAMVVSYLTRAWLRTG